MLQRKQRIKMRIRENGEGRRGNREIEEGNAEEIDEESDAVE